MESSGRLAVLIALVFVARPASGGELLAVEPARMDSLLVCFVRARGLPTPEARSTLESGLPSSLVLDLALLDRRGREVEGVRSEIRIEPDLWEGIFVLRTPQLDRRCRDLKEVTERLTHLGPLPLAVWSALDPAGWEDDTGWRIRARLAVHALAPSETRAMRRLFEDEAAGARVSGSEEPGRRETSVGLSKLLRFFLGRRENERWISEAVSPLFVPATLTTVEGRSEGLPEKDPAADPGGEPGDDPGDELGDEPGDEPGGGPGEIRRGEPGEEAGGEP